MRNKGSNSARERAVKVMKHLMADSSDIRTRVAFAERIGVDPPRINNWETAKGLPTLENIIDICLEFNISPDYLLLGKGDMYGNKETETKLSQIDARLKMVEKKLGIHRDK